MTSVIGIDFGTDSVRALVVDALSGKELGHAVAFYPRWSQGLYCNPSRNQWRQHPLDYIESMTSAVKEALHLAGDDARSAVCGIGIDTTGSTPVAVDQQGTPLALLPGFESNPHAMFVLWKDHTAVKEAAEINSLCSNWHTDYTQYEGGIYSSEWFWAKILKVSRDDESIRQNAYSWVEHCDWIPYLLTGGHDVHTLKASRCAAGHKALWHPSWQGLPPNEFFVQLDPCLNGLVDRLYQNTFTADQTVGHLNSYWADQFDLNTNVSVAVGAFDAHMGAVGGQIEPYYLSKVMGTSTCDILVAPKGEVEIKVKGICGQVDGSVIPGMLGLEAGQSAFGDIYAWFKNVLSYPLTHLIAYNTDLDLSSKSKLIEDTLDQMINRLSEDAAAIPIGSGGVLSLDWMNGRRTPDANQNLKGIISGLHLGSEALHIFRSLVEATCYGARLIVDRFISEGIPIKGIIGLGGVAKKSPFIMQTMANIMNMPIKIAASEQTCALGAAMFAAVASGVHTDIVQAMDAMGAGFDQQYHPEPAQALEYKKYYADYQSLCAQMESHIMKQVNTSHE